MGVSKYVNGFSPTMHDSALGEPHKWKQSHNIFVCSMADLFHESVPFDFIDKVMATINKLNNTDTKY
jgi:protein gp37